MASLMSVLPLAPENIERYPLQFRMTSPQSHEPENHAGPGSTSVTGLRLPLSGGRLRGDGSSTQAIDSGSTSFLEVFEQMKRVSSVPALDIRRYWVLSGSG